MIRSQVDKPTRTDSTRLTSWQATYGKGWSAWMRSRAEAGEFTLPKDVYLAQIKNRPLMVVDRMGRTVSLTSEPE
jgi:hypothetical protein